MRNSAIRRWANNKNKLLNNKTGSKNWLHPPDTLQKGHIVYLVKFLGQTEVEQPKGIEVVKEAIQKLKFSQQIKKAEGAKTPKVELTISIDGVAILEPKTRRNLHQYPLHRISYCADDKAEKRFFSFIAKEGDSDVHTCYVFVSDKLSEEITLTIGQAFDLAYRRFLETSGREFELRKQVTTLQSRVDELKEENETLKERLVQMASLKDRHDLEKFLKDKDISDLLCLNGESSTDSPPPNASPASILPPVPPRLSLHNGSSPNLLDDHIGGAEESEDDFNPRAEESSTSFSNEDDSDFDPRAEEKPSSGAVRREPPPLLPPPPHARSCDLVSFNGSTGNGGVLNKTGADVMAQFDEMKAGFSRGLSFGSADEDFTLDSLDPLKN